MRKLFGEIVGIHITVGGNKHLFSAGFFDERKVAAPLILYYCKGLTSITIPDSVTSIGDDVFYDCTGLTSIIFKGTNYRLHW